MIAEIESTPGQDRIPKVLFMFPMLAVSDMWRSVEFYEACLGFSVITREQILGSYVVVRRGESEIHLIQGTPCPGDAMTIYLMTDDVDLLYAQLRQAGVSVEGPPRERFYAMRDFDVIDPDGHRIRFGQYLESPAF